MNTKNTIFALAIFATMAACSPSISVTTQTSSGDSTASAVPANDKDKSDVADRAIKLVAPAVEDGVIGVIDGVSTVDADRLASVSKTVTGAVGGLTGGSSQSAAPAAPAAPADSGSSSSDSSSSDSSSSDSSVGGGK